jgi:hypothetical protein
MIIVEDIVLFLFKTYDIFFEKYDCLDKTNFQKYDSKEKGKILKILPLK